MNKTHAEAHGYEEQSTFHYFRCGECEFDSIQCDDFTGSENCPLCASDKGRDVKMSRRVARTTDCPEGIDMRAETAKLAKIVHLNGPPEPTEGN